MDMDNSVVIAGGKDISGLNGNGKNKEKITGGKNRNSHLLN